MVVCSMNHSSMEIYIHMQPAHLALNDISSHMLNLQPKDQDLRWRKEYQEVEAHCNGESFLVNKAKEPGLLRKMRKLWEATSIS